ncbi:MAG: fibronectin type III domain-containing protein [Nanoarchaeota archaeon]
MITNKNKLSLSFLAILSVIIIAGIASSLIILDAGLLDFSQENEPTETLGNIARPVALTQQDGSVQESTSSTITCPAISSINGHSDVRVKNVVVKRVRAGGIASAALFSKNLKGIVAWQIYGGCGDDRIRIRASAGDSYNNNTSISIFDQVGEVRSGDSCKSIPQAEIPINVLEKIVPLGISTNGNNWVSLAAYARGDAETHNAEFYSCIYTSCDYDSDGLTSQSCGGSDADDFIPQLDTTASGRITNLILTSSTTSSLSWSWTNPTDSDFSKVLISIDGQNIANSSSTSYTATNLQPGRSYQISIRTQDTTGNINQNAVTRVDATNFPSSGDTTPPIITGITTNPSSPFINKGSQQNVLVSFTSNEYPISVSFQILNSQGNIVITRGPFSLPSSASLPLTLVIPADLPIGIYTIRMSASDNSGNSAQYTAGQFTVTDITPPVTITNLQALNITANSITWTWINPTTPDFSKVIIYLNGQNIVNTSSTSYTATNLQSDRSYTITINTQDIVGNINTTPVSNTARTLSDNTNDDDDSSTTKKKKHKAEVFADYTPIVQNKTQVFEEQEQPIALKSKKESNYSFLILILGIGILFLIVLIIIALFFKASR